MEAIDATELFDLDLLNSCMGFASNSSPSASVANQSTADVDSVMFAADISGNSSRATPPEPFSSGEICNQLFHQLLNQPLHDPNRYFRELVTFVLAGIVGLTVGSLGIIGNLLSLIVLTRRTMQTSSTYCYLAALAMCDLLAVTCILIMLTCILTLIPFTCILILHAKDIRKPQEAQSTLAAVNDFGYYPYIFPYLHPAAFTLQVCSVWLTLAFTVDRYVMICHPYRAYPFCTIRRARKVVAVIVIISCAFNLPKFFEYHTVVTRRAGYDIVFYDFTALGQSRHFKLLYHSFFYVLFVFGVPLLTLVVLNGFLIRAVRASRLSRHKLVARCAPTSTCVSHQRSRGSSCPTIAQCQSCISNLASFATASDRVSTGNGPVLLPPSVPDKRDSTTPMLIGVVVIFVVCQCPALVSRVTWALEETSSSSFTTLPLYILNEVANFFAQLNSSVNIIPYYFFGRRFRRQFLALFCSRFTKKVEGR